MKYREAFSLIKTDYQRYPGGVTVLIHERGFVYSFWLRLAAVDGIFLPVSWVMHHFFSTLYGIQISRHTRIGKGLYIGHGMSICINRSAVIGEHCTIFQMTTIGSWKGKAAEIGDNVMIGPNTNLVENVKIGNNVIIGAGSVVVKDIPDNCVVAGNPAKIIKSL